MSLFSDWLTAKEVKTMKSFNLPDRDLEPLGYREPHCPCCRAVCDFVFIADNGEIVGCENCITRQNSTDRVECYNYND